MHIAFISSFSYPDGGAGAARNLAMARGLTQTGHVVTTMLLSQTDVRPIAHRTDIEWIPLRSAEGRLRPRLWRVHLHARILSALACIHRSSPVDAVIIVNRDPWILRAGRRAASALGIAVFHELTEYPDILPGGRFRTSLESRWVVAELVRMTGVMTISTALESYVASIGVRRVLRTGPMVDLSTIDRPRVGVPDGAFVLGYAGSLSQTKDGVIDLIIAVATVASAVGPSRTIRLELIGGVANSVDLEEARALAGRLGLSETVRFHGEVSAAKAMEIMGECHALVLPRPRSRQAEGGFPTKLGEYLGTSRPVITTPVGDIPRYVTDRVNCFLTPPSDVGALARTIREAADHYDDAAEVGRRGYDLASSAFDPSVAARSIVSFLDLSQPSVS